MVQLQQGRKRRDNACTEGMNTGKVIASAAQVPEPEPESKENRLELEVTDILHKIGMPAHIKGYQYIRTGIVMAVQDISILNYITKLLYPSIAKQYNTTPSSVERAIRHAIEVAWNRGDMNAMQEVFGFSISPERGKPTNSEFIAQIADRYRMDCNLRKMA
jgi:two-component system response regulator (stage 0 sporulation protein A)